MPDLTRGWGFPYQARKAHFFQAGETVSICRHWMFSGPRVDDYAESPDDCAECRRKLLKIREDRIGL